MTGFISERALSGELKRIFSNADDVRIAVAFWGKQAKKLLHLNQVKSARIICNLQSGACDPLLIKGIRDDPRKNLHIRTHRKLHAKIYWTSSAAIVGSSNASTNGLVPVGPDDSGWREGNVCVTDKETLDEIGRWFLDLWGKSLRIRNSMIEDAIAKANERAQRSSELLISGQSLLSSAMANPKAFEKFRINLGFYDDDLSADIARDLSRRRESERDTATPDGISLAARGLGYLENWKSIPTDSWFIECDCRKPSIPRVWGLSYVPRNARHKIAGEWVTDFYQQPGYKLGGRLLELSTVDRKLILRYLDGLRRKSQNGLLELSVAAKYLREKVRSNGEFVIFSCPDSLKQNLDYKVYYEPSSRPLVRGPLIGIYRKKMVTHLGRVVGTAIVKFSRDRIVVIEQDGLVPRNLIRYSHKLFIDVPHKHRKKMLVTSHRLYFVEHFFATMLEKISSGGVRSKRNLVLEELTDGSISNGTSDARKVAAAIKGLTFK